MARRVMHATSATKRSWASLIELVTAALLPLPGNCSPRPTTPRGRAWRHPRRPRRLRGRVHQRRRTALQRSTSTAQRSAQSRASTCESISDMPETRCRSRERRNFDQDLGQRRVSLPSRAHVIIRDSGNVTHSEMHSACRRLRRGAASHGAQPSAPVHVSWRRYNRYPVSYVLGPPMPMPGQLLQTPTGLRLVIAVLPSNRSYLVLVDGRLEWKHF